MTASSSQTPASLLPSDFNTSRVTFIDYHPGLGDKVRKFLAAGCKRIAHQGKFEPSLAARQFFNKERQIRLSRSLRIGHRLGGRLAMFAPSGKEPAIVSMYSLGLDDQGVTSGPSVTAFLDSLYVPATLENPGVLVDNLLMEDLKTQATAWSAAVNTPIGIACYITHRGFGHNLESRHAFMLAAEKIETRTYGESGLYLRTYNAKN